MPDAAHDCVVYVVDDDTSFRNSLCRLLRACGYDAQDFASAQQFLDNPSLLGPACLLLDIKMPEMSGLELQMRLTELGSPLSIVFLTGFGDVRTSVKAMRAGAEDFLTKPIETPELLDAVDRALLRSRLNCDARSQRDAHRAMIATLSPREKEVLKLLLKGKINKQIAHQFGTAERTIKAHRQNLMRKLNARSLQNLFAITENGLLVFSPVGRAADAPVLRTQWPDVEGFDKLEGASLRKRGARLFPSSDVD